MIRSKVSIIPRGVGALGYTIQRPTEDRFLLARHDLENRISVLMGGRAAEALIFDGEVSTGASDDLQRATEIATEMVTRYGMNDTVGPRTYAPPPQPFLTGTTANRVESCWCLWRSMVSRSEASILSSIPFPYQ